jgi:hypothetical protein
LIARGERVVRVPTRLMANSRRSSRERGKSDRIDALALSRPHPSRRSAYIHCSSSELMVASFAQGSFSTSTRPSARRKPPPA